MMFFKDFRKKPGLNTPFCRRSSFFFMFMAVVGVGKMSMVMLQRLMLVHVAVPDGNFSCMEVFMMTILVTVPMIVFHRRMKMDVAVSF